MDPLSIAASIAGLLTAAGEVGKFLGPYVNAAHETPKIAAQVYAEVRATTIILSALQQLSQNLGSVPAKYATLVTLDQVIAVLTDGVLLYSELEASLSSLPSEPPGTKPSLQSRLRWARKEPVFVGVLTRLQGFKGSITLILSILQSQSDLRAAQQQEELAVKVNQLLENNRDVSRRLLNLEDTFDVQSIVSRGRSLVSTTKPTGSHSGTQQPAEQLIQASSQSNQASSHTNQPKISGFDFEDDLEASRVYRRAQRDTMDFSFRSSITGRDGWSVFSGLSLSDISVIAVIALPVYVDDLANPQHYVFGADAGVPTTRPDPPPPKPKGRSILLDCVEVKLQLCQLPGFADLFHDEAWDSIWHAPVSRHTTPRALLFDVMVQGWPLLILRDVLDGSEESRSAPKGGGTHAGRHRAAKQAVFEFLQYCSKTEDLSGNDLPSIAGFFGGNLTEFMKMMTIVELKLARLTSIGVIEPVNEQTLQSSVPISARLIIDEFLGKEQTYIYELQTLSRLGDEIEKYNFLSPGERKAIFADIPKLIEAHLNFLAIVELNAVVTGALQRWEEAFHQIRDVASIYASVIGSEESSKACIRSALKRCQQYVGDRADSLLTPILRLLVLPAERLGNYNPFLMNLLGLVRGVDSIWHLGDTVPDDIQSSLALMGGLLSDINRESKEWELQHAMEELKRLVTNWKGHTIDSFGRLLLFDDLTIFPEKSHLTGRYHVCLFENILTTFRIIYPTKKGPQSLMLLRPTLTDTPQAPIELQFNGRIWISSTLNVISPASLNTGQYRCRVLWKGVEGIESITLAFTTEGQRKLWVTKLQEVVGRHSEESKGRLENGFNLSWLANDAKLENPYALDEDDDDDDDDAKGG